MLIKIFHLAYSSLPWHSHRDVGIRNLHTEKFVQKNDTVFNERIVIADIVYYKRPRRLDPQHLQLISIRNHHNLIGMIVIFNFDLADYNIARHKPADYIAWSAVFRNRLICKQDYSILNRIILPYDLY